MRKHLHRGQRKDTSAWIIGSLTIDNFITKNGIKSAYSIKEIPSAPGDGYEWVQVFPETVGEYTGLQDCNRTE